MARTGLTLFVIADASTAPRAIRGRGTLTDTAFEESRLIGQWNAHETVLECKQGNIAQQPDIEAVVSAANAELLMGGRIAGVIHWNAGPKLDRACRALAPIAAGQAVITSAYNLPNRFVIHCLGPIYGVDRPHEHLLANCYRNALSLAEECEIHSLAFPVISGGAFGYPIHDAAQTALETVLGTLAELKFVRYVRFVLQSERTLGLHISTLESLVGDGRWRAS